jgi:hypothetical protein
MLTFCLATGTAQASLLGRAALTPGGTDYQAYYDDVLNITWLADANLAYTNTFGVSDIAPVDASMTWATANEWIAAMNTAAYLGISDWRLPTITDTGPPGCDYAYSDTDCGFNVDLSTSELAHLFYSTLGNDGYYDVNEVPTGCPEGLSLCLTNTGPFSNLWATGYWSGTSYTPDSNDAWLFNFYVGDQGNIDKGSNEHSWAVSSGDSLAVVPIPPAVWLFGSALGLMGVMRRKLSG